MVRRAGMQISRIKHAEFPGLHGQGLNMITQVLCFCRTFFPIAAICLMPPCSHQFLQIHMFVVHKLQRPHFDGNVAQRKPGGYRVKVIRFTVKKTWFIVLQLLDINMPLNE